MPNHELISQAEYARRRGVSRPAVSKAIKRCGIPLVNGKLDPLVADTLWKARTDGDQARRALAQQRPAPAGPGEAVTWRERIDRARALRDEHALAVRRAEYVLASQVLKTWQGGIMAFRSRILGIPHRLALPLAGTSDPARCAEILGSELHDALRELAGDGLPADD